MLKEDRAMKRLTILVTVFAFLCPVGLLADTIPIQQLSLFYQPSTSTSHINIWSQQLEPLPSECQGEGCFPFKFHTGTFTNVGTSLVCGNAACTSLSVDLKVSGLRIKDVIFQGFVYPTVYLSGTLDIAGTLPTPGGGFCGFLDSPTCFFGSSIISGNFTGCSDPACSTQLFPLSANLVADGAVYVRFNSQGKPVLQAAAFNAPEPSGIALLGTGCSLLFGALLIERFRRHRAG
jgi:hypothetical protein